MTVDEALNSGRALVEEIRAEVGWDPEGENDPDALTRYIEALEASVAGQRAAMHTIARSSRATRYGVAP
jgi:hypothetical protein